jgi:hypothetical protein
MSKAKRGEVERDESLAWAEARLSRREDAAAFGVGQLFQAGEIYKTKYAALRSENSALREALEEVIAATQDIYPDDSRLTAEKNNRAANAYRKARRALGRE